MKHNKNHGAQIRRRLKETFGRFPKNDRDAQNPGAGFQGWNHLWEQMTPEERAWAEKFERLEYQIERGYANEAIAIAKELNPSVSQEATQRIREDVESKKRCNPAKMESDRKADIKRGQNKGIRAPKSNMYEPYDWYRNAGTMQAKDEDNAEVERGITLNPEDALIEALDAAAKHGVSLETFINDSRYHTPEPEKKPGRPKKMEVVK